MIFKDPNADASTFNFSDLRDYTAMNKTRESMHPIMDATEGRSAIRVDDGRRSAIVQEETGLVSRPAIMEPSLEVFNIRPWHVL